MTAVPDNTKRIAQTIVNDKVQVLWPGFGVTPAALGCSVVGQDQGLEIVHSGRHIHHRRKSPYIARTSFHWRNPTVPMADWAADNGIEVGDDLDSPPGVDAEKSFTGEFTKKGGQRSPSIAFPLPVDFAPFLQRAADQARRHLRLCSLQAGHTFVKQFVERGLDKAGIKIIGQATWWMTICSTAWATR